MGVKTTVISQEQLEAQYAFCDKIENYWHQAGRTPKALRGNLRLPAE